MPRKPPKTWAEDLDHGACAHAGPDCGGDEIYLHSRCHVHSPTWARYLPGERTLEIVCAVCRSPVAAVQVALRHEALPDSPPERGRDGPRSPPT